MKNGETRKVGSATIVCSVMRGSYYPTRDDAWMGSKTRSRASYSHTTYRVIGSDGRQVATLIEGYANAVKIATATK